MIIVKLLDGTKLSQCPHGKWFSCLECSEMAKLPADTSCSWIGFPTEPREFLKCLGINV